MQPTIDSAKVRREQIRWVLLQGLYNARPQGAYEQVLLSIIQALYPDSTQLEIRRELDYLEARSLAELRKEPSGRWWADLTRHGVDFCEYTIDAQAGIARPEKYW